MRIIQQFEPAGEAAFMALEKKFHELELARPDYPKGRRMVPVSAHDPNNTLIWQHEFPTIEEAYKMLHFFAGDSAHDDLFRDQVKLMKEVRVEFFRTLDFD